MPAESFVQHHGGRAVSEWAMAHPWLTTWILLTFANALAFCGRKR